jgi:hypothetical protein
VQFLLDKFPEAEKNYRAALAAAIAIGGDDHVDALQTRLRLGNFLAETSRLPEGVAGHVTGWALSAWNDARREPDEVAAGMRSDNPGMRHLQEMRWWPCTTLFLPRDQRLGHPTWPVTDEDRARADAEAVEAPFLGLPAVADAVPNLVRTWVALWQLFGEERGPGITEQAHPQRPALRLARRVLQTSDITVTVLRRRPGHHTGTGTPLDHRVPVDEHTRGYWVTGRACTCDVRVDERHLEKRKIAEHIRGSTGPLIVRKKLSRLAR